MEAPQRQLCNFVVYHIGGEPLNGCSRKGVNTYWANHGGMASIAQGTYKIKEEEKTRGSLSED